MALAVNDLLARTKKIQQSVAPHYINTAAGPLHQCKEMVAHYIYSNIGVRRLAACLLQS